MLHPSYFPRCNKGRRFLHIRNTLLGTLSFSLFFIGCSSNGGGARGDNRGGSYSNGGDTHSGGKGGSGVTNQGGSTSNYNGGSSMTGGSSGSPDSGVSAGGNDTGISISDGLAGDLSDAITIATPITGGVQLGGATSPSGSGGQMGGTISPGTGGTTTGGKVASGTGGTSSSPILPVPIAPKTGDLWVSPSGNDGNSGTQESPLKELSAAILKAAPGKTIWMTAGTHTYSIPVIIEPENNGTENQPIVISGDLNGPRPVIDFTGTTGSAQGLRMRANYWHLRYLEIKEASDSCIHLSGSHNLLERLDVHDCGDTGIQLSKWSRYLPAHNRIINCDSYLNADNSGENADGFGAKLIIGPGNLFHGCRAWNNVDDAWDTYDARNVVVFENCWAIESKHPTMSKGVSDGNGFKLGGQRRENGWYDQIAATDPIKIQFPTYADYLAVNNLPHKLTHCFAFHSPATGFDRNGNPSTEVTCTNCGAWGNGVDVEDGIKMLGERIDLPRVTPAKAIAAKRDANGNLPDIRTLM